MKSSLLLLSTLSLTAWSGIGFFENDWEARTPSPITSSIVQNQNSTKAATANFVIDVTDTTSKVLPTIWGNNSNFYMYKFDSDSSGLEHIKSTGVKNLRLPGGNVSNQWLWNGKVSWELWENYESTLSSPPHGAYNLSSDDQAGIADMLGAAPQPCVNVVLSRFIKGADSVQQAASYAADWVRQWNIVERRNVKYWEIGNENYGGWSAGYIVNGDTITGKMYGEMFQVFADSMKAVDPTIKLGAVVFEGESNPWTGTWNKDLLPLVENYADYLVVHQYFTFAQDANDVSVKQMVEALPLIEETIEGLETEVEAYTNKKGDHFPIAMTEFNVRAGRKNTQQISAVFNAMALGEFVRHNYGLVNIWNIANSFSQGNDHGMLTRNDPDRDDYNPNPSFYSYFLTQKYFGDHMVKNSPEHTQGVQVYSTLFSNGNLGILAVNSGDAEQTTQFDLQNFTGSGKIYSHHLTASGPESREVFLNGFSESNVSGPLNYKAILPYSWNFSSNPRFDLEPYSVNVFLIESDGVVSSVNSIASQSQSKQFWQLPMQSKSLFSQEKPKRLQAFGLNGQEVQVEWKWTNQQIIFTGVRNQMLLLDIQF